MEAVEVILDQNVPNKSCILSSNDPILTEAYLSFDGSLKSAQERLAGRGALYIVRILLYLLIFMIDISTIKKMNDVLLGNRIFW